MPLRRLLTDEKGSVLVEVTIAAALIIFLVLGSVDFLFAFYRWNAAGKAVQAGARIAAVSDSVATGLNDLSVDVGGTPLTEMPAFTMTCPGNAASCTCTDGGAGTCAAIGNPVLDQNALNKIVYGRGYNPANPGCGSGGGIYFVPECAACFRASETKFSGRCPFANERRWIATMGSASPQS